MSSIGPVDIEFALKNINFQAEAAKMKAEISGVVNHTETAAKVMSSAMNDFASNSAKEMKASIAIQKDVIKDLQQSIKELQSTANNSTGRNKTDAQSALGLAKKDLVAEQGALLMMQKEQTALNAREAESQLPIIGGLWKWAAGLATVTAAMKIGKEIIESTEGTAKQFEFAMSGAESALSYFWKTLATGDFSSFMTNMESAIKVGYKYAEMMHEVKEAGWAQSMKESEMLKPNTQLEIDLRNTSLPKDIRLAAGNTRIKNEEELSKGRIDIAEKELNAAMTIAEERSKIDSDAFDATKRQDDKTYLSKFKLLELLKQVDATTRAQAEEFNKDHGSDKAAAYPDALAMLTKPGYKMLPQQKEMLKDLKKAYDVTPEVKLYADALRGYGDLKEEMIVNVVNAYKKIGEADDSSIKGLKRVFTTVSGVKREISDKEAADAKKAQEEANKASKDQLNYDSEKGRKTISDQLDIDQKKLNLQKDGAEKLRQQAELDYRKTLVDLANQKADQLKKLNESPAVGGIDLKSGKTTDTYVSTLPESQQKPLDDKAVLAEALKNKTIGDINEKEAQRIKEIWAEVTDYRMKGIDKEKAAVKDYYDNKEQEVRKANTKETPDLLAGIEEMRNQKNSEINQKYALQELHFEEKIENQKNEIQATGFDREAKLMKLNFDTWVKYRLQEIAMLSNSENPEDQKKAKLMEGDIDIETKKEDNKLLAEHLKTITQISGALDGIISKYKEQLGLTDDQSKILKDTLSLTDGITKIASGDVVGGGIQALTSLADMFITVPEKLSVHFEAINKQISQLIQSLDLADKSLSHLGKDSSITTLKVIKSELLGLAEDAAKLNTELGKSSTGKRRSENLNMPLSTNLVKQAADLNIEIEKLSNRLIQGDISTEQRKSIVALLNSYNDLLGAIDHTIQDITGTTVSDLSRGLADAFLSGEDAAAAWGAKVDDIIKNVIVRQMTAQLLTKPITDAVNTLVNDSGDGLTTEEAAKFKKSMDDLYASTAPVFEATQKALQAAGFNMGSSASASASNTAAKATGLSGSIHGASEETMGALVGQFMAVRVDIKEIMRTMAMGQEDVGRNLLYLKQISENTSHNYRLITIESELKEMNATLKSKL